MLPAPPLPIPPPPPPHSHTHLVIHGTSGEIEIAGSWEKGHAENVARVARVDDTLLCVCVCVCVYVRVCIQIHIHVCVYIWHFT